MSERDIVERLRDCGRFGADGAERICVEAADEIKRLRIQRDAAVRELGEQGRKLGKAEAENDRLRAALLDIIQTGRREDITAPTALGYVLKIAREAVEGKG